MWMLCAGFGTKKIINEEQHASATLNYARESTPR